MGRRHRRAVAPRAPGPRRHGQHITGRIIRLAGLFQSAYAEVFAPLGLKAGDYGVLASLRRTGAPHRLTPTDLARHQMMTSGGMTAALDRLERKRLVVRLPNPDDRRGSLGARSPSCRCG